MTVYKCQNYAYDNEKFAVTRFEMKNFVYLMLFATG